MRGHDGGYSLIEVLAALFIVAMLSAAAYGAINNALTAQEVLGQREERLRALQITRTIMRDDLAQLAPPRVVREAFGDDHPLVFHGGVINEDEPILVFLRTGWSNPGGVERRGPLQRVTYYWRDGALVREAWARPDVQPDTPVSETIILADVTDVRLRFVGEDWSGGPRWREDWRIMAPGATVGDAFSALPRLVELELEASDFGTVRHVFAVPDLPEFDPS